MCEKKEKDKLISCSLWVLWVVIFTLSVFSVYLPHKSLFKIWKFVNKPKPNNNIEKKPAWLLWFSHCLLLWPPFFYPEGYIQKVCHWGNSRLSLHYACLAQVLSTSSSKDKFSREFFLKRSLVTWFSVNRVTCQSTLKMHDWQK